MTINGNRQSQSQQKSDCSLLTHACVPMNKTCDESNGKGGNANLGTAFATCKSAQGPENGQRNTSRIEAEGTPFERLPEDCRKY